MDRRIRRHDERTNREPDAKSHEFSPAGFDAPRPVDCGIKSNRRLTISVWGRIIAKMVNLTGWAKGKA